MRTSPPPSGRSASWPRENANGARAKSGGRTVPVGPELIRLYADYLHEEYGEHRQRLCFRQPLGGAAGAGVVVCRRPTTWSLRLRARDRPGFRPALVPALGGDQVAARRRVRRGGLQAAGSLIGDHDVGHLRASHCEDARAALEKAGWLTGREVSLVTGGWVTQADRDRWQRDAARELAAILGGLRRPSADRVDGRPPARLAAGDRPARRAGRCGPRSPPGGRRWAWTTTETAVSGGTWLRARAGGAGSASRSPRRSPTASDDAAVPW